MRSGQQNEISEDEEVVYHPSNLPLLFLVLGREIASNGMTEVKVFTHMIIRTLHRPTTKAVVKRAAMMALLPKVMNVLLQQVPTAHAHH
jgi:hypothetical protein